MAKRSFKIARFTIKEDDRVFLIAEAGVNHNGELKKALALVDLAAKSGADAVKFQTFRAEQVVTERSSQRKMLRRLELKEEFYQPILQRCQKRNILFLSTPHGGRESVDFLESLGVVAYKVGSGDLTNYILLEKIAWTKKPIILSSGMATLQEIKEALSFIKSKGNRKIVVLHCTTSYPCLPEEVNLAAMLTLMKKLDVPVGYSDHTQGNQVAVMAATLGAAVYECHFTLDKKLPGPDHLASADPKELKAKIDAVRQVQMIMGDKRKKPTQKEKKEMMSLVRKSLVVRKNLPVGHKLTRNDLEAKRPGDGMSPVKYEKVVGKKLKKPIKVDEQLTSKHIKNSR